jgi:hypothetical protein
MQAANLNSKSTLNFNGGQTETTGGDSKTKKKNVSFRYGCMSVLISGRSVVKFLLVFSFFVFTN